MKINGMCIFIIILIFNFFYIENPAVAQKGQQYFEKGTVRLTATDNDGWASLSTYVYRWDDERRDWNQVAKGSTSNGKRDYSLAPGVYKLEMYYREASPNEKRVIESIHVFDRPGICNRRDFRWWKSSSYNFGRRSI